MVKQTNEMEIRNEKRNRENQDKEGKVLKGYAV